jgi:hypothetical protein
LSIVDAFFMTGRRAKALGYRYQARLRGLMPRPLLSLIRSGSSAENDSLDEKAYGIVY